MVGYKNFSYFTRVFHQHVGMSPSDFIRQNKLE
ncbi:MAG: AraC family transcriptional regulator [Bacteroidaceae bacterium]|nr:AraC family transcriptional regulator [Bacteroidaceae bacterium]